MRSESHRRALLAAARIAAGAALLGGCHDPAPIEAAAVREPVPASALDVDACTAMVDGTNFEKPVSAEVKGCCQKLADDADGKGQVDFAHRGECCSELGWQGSMACTPWGPPTPPEMTA